MLGAHARAAEYNAAKKAQARQASREAEEQKVPPPAAPISLGAFTRPVTSRNKGTKAYIPLVLEITPEADREPYEDDLAETPTKRSSKPSTPATRLSGTLHTGDRISTFRNLSFVGGPPPTAPRSMIREQAEVRQQPIAAAPSTYVPRPQSMPVYHDTPPRFQQHIIIPAQYSFQFGLPAPHLIPPPEYTWPSQHPFPNHPYPYPPPPVQPQPQPRLSATIFDSPAGRPVPLPRSDPQPRRPLEIRRPSEKPSHKMPKEPESLETPQEQVRRYVFGPDDLSPSKQELKQSARRAQFGAGPGGSGTLDRPKLALRGSEDIESNVLNPIRMRDPTHAINSSPILKLENRPPAVITTTPRAFRHGHGESLVPGHSSQQGSFPNPLRQFKGMEDDDEGPVTAVPWMRSGNIPDNLLSTDDESHYDRAAKMQKFVAVQQSLKQQGKTVLHNPERQYSASVASQGPSVSIDSTGGPGPALPEEQARNLPQAIHRPTSTFLPAPPGLLKPEIPFVPSAEQEQEEADRKLRESFGVGSDDWFDLKPPSRSERRKMQAALERVRKKDAKQQPRQAHTTDRWYTDGKAQQLIEEDTRSFPRARERISDVAEDYSIRLHAAVGQVRPAQGEVDVHAGMVRGAGHMFVNLSENLIDQKDGRDYFNRTKKVPESAIDRAALASDPGTTSLFEDKLMKK